MLLDKLLEILEQQNDGLLTLLLNVLATSSFLVYVPGSLTVTVAHVNFLIDYSSYLLLEEPFWIPLRGSSFFHLPRRLRCDCPIDGIASDLVRSSSSLSILLVPLGGSPFLCRHRPRNGIQPARTRFRLVWPWRLYLLGIHRPCYDIASMAASPLWPNCASSYPSQVLLSYCSRFFSRFIVYYHARK